MKNAKKGLRALRYTVLLIPLSFAALFTFAACAACTPSMERLGHLVSELRENIFVGESDNFRVSIITGFREDPFLMDGRVGELRDFTLITLTPKSETSEGNYTFVTTVDGVQFRGAFLPHPFSNTLSAEINVRAGQNEIPLTVINAAGVEESLFAKSVLTEQMIGVEKALEIAENKLRYSLEVFKVNGVLQAEIYIRIMPNPIDNSGGYHWYVAFIGQNQTIFAVLIDPISMQVVAVRN